MVIWYFLCYVKESHGLFTFFMVPDPVLECVNGIDLNSSQHNLIYCLLFDLINELLRKYNFNKYLIAES